MYILTCLYESQWLFASFHGGIAGQGRVSELFLLIVPLILLSFHLLCCWSFLAEGIYIFYAYIKAFLKKSTRSNLATLLIFASNKIPIQSQKNCLLETWVNGSTDMQTLQALLHFTTRQPRREQKKASSHQVGKKLSLEHHHRCNNGLWLHYESDPENAFLCKVQIGRRIHHLVHMECTGKVYAVYHEYVWNT